jgi:hypothetical protein
MDILSNYRISALIATDRELAVNAERARVATERAQRTTRRTAPAVTTGSLACVPSTSH